MAGSNSKRPRPGGLVSELDRRVSRIVRDFMLEEQAATSGPVAVPTTSALVEYVREVDKGLRRNKVLQIENSVLRVLPGVQQLLDRRQASGADGAGSSDEEPALDGLVRFDALEDVPTMEVKDANAMNGSLMRLWGTRADSAAAAIGTATMLPEEPAGGGQGACVGASAKPRTPAGGAASSAEADSAAPATAAGTGPARDASDGRGRDPKRRRREKAADRATRAAPETRLADLGGVDACIEEVLELIVMPLKHPEIYMHTGVQPPRGVLLHGPPGCGKTLLAHAIAGEVGVPFLQISAPSVVSGMSGESEKKLREVFDEARELAPCIVFIDEIDAITPKRENAQREMERRIVAQMLTCIDDLSWEKTSYRPVLLIGATNRPDSLDPALRRAGRFDREISMSVPDEDAREQILRVLCKRLRLSGDFDIRELAKRTPGYVGADLTALTTAAGMIAVKRIFHKLQALAADGSGLPEVLADRLSQTAVDGDEGGGSSGHGGGQDDGCDVMDTDMDGDDRAADSTPALWDSRPVAEKLRTIAGFLEHHPEPLTPEELAPLAITNADFIQALAKVQPSAKREGFATVPGVTWDDIGALGKVREELRMAVVEPIRNPEIFAQVGITAPAGVLLWGPPGNGKTLLAKAIANESHTNFISVKGGELMSKYVGDSERAVRQVFSRARASSPCVIFFDELDALCSRRSGEQSEASARVVNTLLTEIDGMEARKKVYVIAATNRPDIIDPAMLRPGRLDKLLYVELPTRTERAEILRTLAKKTPLGDDVDLAAVAADNRCDGFSGADLAGLVREASVAALRAVVFNSGPAGTGLAAQQAPRGQIRVTGEHFAVALGRTAPSVSATDMKRYEALRRLYGS
ncbi:Ribosome biogenesis ATPase rix7 [Coemansia biformis]|uniref:Ribosome biogenesis ATPase rix7 n=1 Tax=Coemansia biformis TaxID=1286918 RepID=A0A9W8CZ84_9FUNG|nr:Ribosome biogenesis ATPase rix7 [Coemansia biformis]